MIVSFEKNGHKLTGKIKEMPAALMEKWVQDPSGKQHIKNQLVEAKQAFLRVYLENSHSFE